MTHQDAVEHENMVSNSFLGVPKESMIYQYFLSNEPIRLGKQEVAPDVATIAYRTDRTSCGRVRIFPMLSFLGSVH